MPDHNFEPPPPDLRLIADLIDSSSLGNIDAIEAQNEVPADVTMRLRDRARQDAPARRWDTLPESAVVLREVGDVFPNVDGSFSPPSLPPDGTVLALNRMGQGQVLDRAALRLPGGPDRRHWTIHVGVTDHAFRCRLQHRFLDRFPRPRWTVDAAIWWQLADPETAASTNLRTLTSDLLVEAASRVGYSVKRPPDTVGKQLLYEYAINQLLRERGVTAECAIRVTTADEPGAEAPPPAPLPQPVFPHSRVMAEPREPLEGSLRFLGDRVLSLMEALYNKGWKPDPSELRDYMDLIAERHSTAVIAPAERPTLSYLMAVLDEALRLVGVQVDEAAEIVAAFIETEPPTLLVRLAVLVQSPHEVSDTGRKAAFALIVEHALHISARTLRAAEQSTVYQAIRVHDEDDVDWTDIEARREERYQFDDLLT